MTRGDVGGHRFRRDDASALVEGDARSPGVAGVAENCLFGEHAAANTPGGVENHFGADKPRAKTRLVAIMLVVPGFHRVDVTPAREAAIGHTHRHRIAGLVVPLHQMSRTLLCVVGVSSRCELRATPV